MVWPEKKPAVAPSSYQVPDMPPIEAQQPGSLPADGTGVPTGNYPIDGGFASGASKVKILETNGGVHHRKIRARVMVRILDGHVPSLVEKGLLAHRTRFR